LGKQFHTLGFDINAQCIAELQAGHDRTLETTASGLVSKR
jgi:UDP-N-acetyl-D-mannosaminuronate dehydrogenase